MQDRFKVFPGDASGAEMNRLGRTWPQHTIVNQQDRQSVQNRVVVVRPDGEAVYFERVSLTLQPPDFDFRNFPFDKQQCLIRLDLLAPEWMHQLREIAGYREVGKKLGDEEWVISAFDTSISRVQILQRPVSRFNKDYAKRIDAAGANLLLFIAFNFAISGDLPRLGYLTFLDTLLISALLVTAVVLILSVYPRRKDMSGRDTFCRAA